MSEIILFFCNLRSFWFSTFTLVNICPPFIFSWFLYISSKTTFNSYNSSSFLFFQNLRLVFTGRNGPYYWSRYEFLSRNMIRFRSSSTRHQCYSFFDAFNILLLSYHTCCMLSILISILILFLITIAI